MQASDQPKYEPVARIQQKLVNMLAVFGQSVCRVRESENQLQDCQKEMISLEGKILEIRKELNEASDYWKKLEDEKLMQSLKEAQEKGD